MRPPWPEPSTFPQTRLWLAIYGLIAGFVIAAIIYLLLPLIRALFHMIARLFDF